MQVATKHISWINTKKTEAQSKKSIPKCKIYKEIKLLYQIQKKKLQAHVAERINNIDQANFNSQIEEINQVYQTQIRPLPEYWSQVDINELKNWRKVLRKKVEEEECKNKEQEISTRIEQRFGMMKENKKKMLQSLLNKPYNKVTIDRVLREESTHYQNQELIVDESLVKQQVTAYFQKQFKKRNQKFEEMNQKWKKEYEPKKDINSDLYKNIISPISEEEWTQALRKTQNKTAPGISGIGYILLKKVSPKQPKYWCTFKLHPRIWQNSRKMEIRAIVFNSKRKFLGI